MDSVARDLETWLAQMPAANADVERLRQRIGRLSRLFDRVLDQVADAQQISRGDWTTLSVLVRVDRPCTPTELMHLLELTSGTVSTRLKRLTEAGLVEAVGTSADGRSRPVRITGQGRALWAGATAERTRREEQLVRDALGDRRLHAVDDGLGTLLDAMERELGPGGKHDLPRSR